MAEIDHITLDGVTKYLKDTQARDDIATLSGAVDNKMDKVNPTGSGAFSMGRVAESVVGTDSHAEGYNVTASGSYSHAEGGLNVASGRSSHAEGSGNTASGQDSHAENSRNTASGTRSHAEGYQVVASGEGSHAEGKETEANGNYSHAEGKETIASSDYQHVFGQGNVEDDQGEFVEIVGNGSRDEPSNARTLDWEGNETIAGDFKGGNKITATRDNGAARSQVGAAVSDNLGVSSIYLESESTGTRAMRTYNSNGGYLTLLSVDDNFNISGAIASTYKEGSDTSATSLSNNVWTAASSVQLSEGIWLLIGQCSFQGNSSGIRATCICPTSGSESNAIAHVRTPATGGTAVTQNLSGAVNVTSGTPTYYLNMAHNAGTSLNIVSRSLVAIRLGRHS